MLETCQIGSVEGEIGTDRTPGEGREIRCSERGLESVLGPFRVENPRAGPLPVLQGWFPTRTFASSAASGLRSVGPVFEDRRARNRHGTCSSTQSCPGSSLIHSIQMSSISATLRITGSYSTR